MKNTSVIPGLFVTIKRAAAFKSQPHANNTMQLAEQKPDVLALFFSAVTYSPLG